MNTLTFRTLYADEIDIRVARITKDGAQLLLYKDARCDMNILDETVGAFGWQRTHSRDNANCMVMIYNEATHDWIVKEDTGTESNTEAAKGLASDSFKRACVNWGIGRELYTSPFIWIKPDNVQLEKNDRTGKMMTYDKFEVEDIAYDEKKNIIGLAIRNTTLGKRAFVWQKKDNTPPENTPPDNTPPDPKIICVRCKEPITPIRNANGEKRTVQQVAEYVKKESGAEMCYTCFKHWKNGENI